MPKLSIITVTLNDSKGLKKTIESVVSQTFTDYEYIVIDGGSTDGSVEIIKQYAEKITYWISEPDKGVFQAMNKGIQRANGDYCLFMNSGDCIYSQNTLYNIFSKQKEYDVDFMVGSAIIVTSRNKKVRIKIPPLKITAKHLIAAPLCHQSTFIKTNILKLNPYDENLRIAADWVHMFQEFVFGNASYLKLNEIVSTFDNGGISSTNLDLARNERNIFLNEN